jgi:hypothetical protein
MMTRRYLVSAAALGAGAAAAQAPAAKIDDIQALLAQRDCERLSAVYAHAFDFNEGGKLADVFAENGKLVLSIAELKNAKEIVDFANKRAHEMSSGEFTGSRGNKRVAVVGQHVTTNFQFEMIDADHARGRAYLTLFMWPAGEKRVESLSPSLAGYFEDKYVRTAKGWRIEERKLTSTRSGML